MPETTFATVDFPLPSAPIRATRAPGSDDKIKFLDQRWIKAAVSEGHIPEFKSATELDGALQRLRFRRLSVLVYFDGLRINSIPLNIIEAIHVAFHLLKRASELCQISDRITEALQQSLKRHKLAHGQHAIHDSQAAHPENRDGAKYADQAGHNSHGLIIQAEFLCSFQVLCLVTTPAAQIIRFASCGLERLYKLQTAHRSSHQLS